MNKKRHIVIVSRYCARMLEAWHVEIRWKKKKSLQNINACSSLTHVYILSLICSSIKFSAISTDITRSICLILSCSSLRITHVWFTRARAQRRIIFWMNNYNKRIWFFLPKLIALSSRVRAQVLFFSFLSCSNWRSDTLIFKEPQCQAIVSLGQTQT